MEVYTTMEKVRAKGMELEFKDVSGKKKGFALKNISFTVQNGFITGLIGHNGAGKTTLFHYIMDEDAAYEGSILVDGKELAVEHTKAMNYIGFVSEEQVFFKDKTARENVELFRTLYEEFSVEIFTEQMKKMELSVNKTVGKMSRGEFLKFQMAFAMAHYAKLYLLDEVTAGMDPVFKKDFFRILHELMKEEDVAILMSTHIEEEIEIHMDYIAILEKGSLVSFEEVVTFK